VSLHNC